MLGGNKHPCGQTCASHHFVAEPACAAALDAHTLVHELQGAGALMRTTHAPQWRFFSRRSKAR